MIEEHEAADMMREYQERMKQEPSPEGDEWLDDWNKRVKDHPITKDTTTSIYRKDGGYLAVVEVDEHGPDRLLIRQGIAGFDFGDIMLQDEEEAKWLIRTIESWLKR